MLVAGSDCFFDPAIFEDILVTVSYILNQNSGAKFFCTYQERSTDWTIEHLLNKWKLRAKVHDLSNLGAKSGVELSDIFAGHTIHLLEIDCKA